MALEEKHNFCHWTSQIAALITRGRKSWWYPPVKPSDGSSDFRTSEVVSRTFFCTIRWVTEGDGWLLDPLTVSLVCPNMRKQTVKPFESKSLQSGRWSSSGNAVNWNRVAGLEANNSKKDRSPPQQDTCVCVLVGSAHFTVPDDNYLTHLDVRMPLTEGWTWGIAGRLRVGQSDGCGFHRHKIINEWNNVDEE